MGWYSRSQKNYLIKLLRSEFPQLPHLQFDASRMLKKAAKIMRSRRSELNDRVRDGRGRPTWCDEDLWEELVQRLNANPDLGNQQRRAREAQHTPSHLGSGGWSVMKRDFVRLWTSWFNWSIAFLFIKFIRINFFNDLNINREPLTIETLQVRRKTMHLQKGLAR